jgi:hypothetical protein
MLSASVLGATALLVVGCASQVSPRTSGDSPTIETPSSEQPEEGPADLRVQLEPTLFGAATEPPPSVETGGEGHSAEALQTAVAGYSEALRTCEPAVALSGEFSLFLELSEDGYVLGGSTNPSPGQEGVSAVAGCTLKQARTWLFPSRKRRGRTILIIPFVVAGI